MNLFSGFLRRTCFQTRLKANVCLSSKWHYLKSNVLRGKRKCRFIVFSKKRFNFFNIALVLVRVLDSVKRSRKRSNEIFYLINKSVKQFRNHCLFEIIQLFKKRLLYFSECPYNWVIILLIDFSINEVIFRSISFHLFL